MKRMVLFLFLLTLLPAFQSRAQDLSMATAPVLIELFTSQGCSSCPPAEALLGTWGNDLFKAHKALPLAFHVDYWDYLGWKDPYSFAAASDRQRAYGAFFQANSVYTPQMIVQGQVGFNGSDLDRTQLEVSRAQAPSTALGLSVVVHNGSIKTKVTLPEDIRLSGNTMLCAALFENGLVTSVEEGENRGRSLRESFVVLSWIQVPYSELGKGKELSLQNPGSNLSQSGVAVWLQDQQTMKVQGLNWVYPLSKK